MNEQIAAALTVLPQYLGWHVMLSAAALALGVVIAAPLSVAAARSPRFRRPVLALAGLVQTVPSLALLALFYPLLLALSAALKPVTGIELPALGFLPSLLALTLYSILPILRNGVAGLRGVDSAVLEAADALGMTARQKLLRVELPLAAPVAMAGVRTAAIWTIGAATLSTPVGQTSLGDYIFSGLQTENWVFVLFGCGASAALAVTVDQLLGLVEAGIARRDRKRIGLGLGALLIGTVAASAPLVGSEKAAYMVGAKNFSEQFILADLIADRLRMSGASTETRQGLGSAVIFKALAAGDIDVYVDYSGTLWTNVLGRKDTPSRTVMLAELTETLKATYGVTVLGSLGFENAYALAMPLDRANALGVTTLEDLAGRSRSLTLGSDLEFLSRPEWAALKNAYGFSFKVERSFTPTFMYRALSGGEVDVISAFSSDGRIAADRLKILTDSKGAAPAYDAVMLVSPKRLNDRRLIDALRPLIGKITLENMQRANLSVDRDQNKLLPETAAQALATQLGLP